MKTIKLILLCLILAFSSGVYSQNQISKKNVFIRVFNFEGNKIGKGSIVFINDSVLGLKKGNKKLEISYNNVGKIKTKRSAGNNVLFGASVGAALGAIIGVSSSDPESWVLGYTAAEGAVAFGSLGAIGGAAIGEIASAIKKTETYIIDGDLGNWKNFKSMIEKKIFR